MVGLADRVTGIECATPLEAEVRELRLIAEHKPRYNRRSRFPERVHWIKLTREPWPRLSLVRHVLDDGADYLGPYSSKRAAERSVAALHEAFPIRQCGGRMPKRPGAQCLRARGDGQVPVALRRQRLRGGLHRGRRPAARRRCVAGSDPVVASVSTRMTRARPRQQVRGRRARGGTGWSRSCAAPPAPSGCAR